MVQERPNASKVRLPPTLHSTLKKVIAVSTEARKASTRSMGASVAMRTSSEMRYSGFSEPFASWSSRRNRSSASQYSITWRVTDSRHLRCAVMRPQTEMAASAMLASAKGTNSFACVHKADASRRSTASKKFRFHKFRSSCTSTCAKTTSMRITVRPQATLAQRPNQKGEAVCQKRAKRRLSKRACCKAGLIS